MNNSKNSLGREAKKPRFYYGYTVATSSFLMLMVYGGLIYATGIFFMPLLAEFGWSRAALSAAFSIGGLVGGLFQIVTGRLNDRWGPRIVITITGVSIFLGYFLMSQISAIWHIFAIRILMMSFGMSALIPLRSTVVKWFAKRRGLMTGIVVAGIGLGGVIMPPIANWLITTYGWRTSYTVVAIAAFVLIAGLAQFMRRNPAELGLLPDGEVEVKTAAPKPPVKGYSWGEAIRTKQFWMLAIMWAFFGYSYRAIMVHIVVHVIDTGISPAIAASVLTTIGAASMAGRIVMGGVGDKIGRKSAFAIGFFLLTVALLVALVAEELWTFYLFAVIFGFAYGGGVSLISPFVADIFGLGSHGIILGSVFYGMSIGGFAGPTLSGYIFDTTGSYQLTFLIGGILSIIGLIIILLLKPLSKKGGENDPEGSA